MKIDLAAMSELIRSSDDVIITSHVRPDGDSVGSALGMMHFVRSLGKKVRVIIDDEVPRTLNFLPGSDEIDGVTEGETYESDLLIVLDVELKRIGRVIEQVKAKKVLNIDHHRTNDEEAEYLYLDFYRAATAEIVHELISFMKADFTEDMALCLYTGMATDTGFFRFSNTQPRTMRAAADLLEITGRRPNYIADAVEMKSYEEVIGQAKGICHTELLFNGQAAFLFIDEELVKEIPSTEGILNRIIEMEGVRVAVFLKWSEPDTYRVSMRAKDIDVSRVAQNINGGGHRRAAGATLNMSFDEARTKLIEIIGQELAQ